MNKPVWLQELELELDLLQLEEQSHRTIAAADPVAAGIAHAVKRIRERIVHITDPSAERTPAQFAAEQTPRVTEQAVRLWIKSGQLPARQTAKGWRIPAGAVRTKSQGRAA